MSNICRNLSLDAAKTAVRLAHHGERPRCHLEALEQADRAWRKYEQLNRDFCPEDPVFSVVRTGITPVAGSDYFTFVGAASRQARLLEIILGSEGTSSAAARAIWQRSTGGTTGGGALTPEKFNQLSPASGAFGNIFTTWAAQPTLSGNPTLAWAWNALGGYVAWKAAPGEEIYMQGSSEQNSFRNAAGTAVLSVTAIFEEL